MSEAIGDHREQPSKDKFLLYFVLFLLAVIFVTSIRYRSLSVPFERDEGEYAYAAWLILQGSPPFEDAYNMKMPGIYWVYAGIMALLGESVEGVHLGLILVTLCSSALLFWLLCRMYGPLVGFVGALFLLFLPLAPGMTGLPANAEHFVLLPAVAGILMLEWGLRGEKPWLYVCGGFLLGVGFIIKQHAFAFILFGLAYSIYAFVTIKAFNKRRTVLWLLSFCVAAGTPFVLVVGYVTYHHVEDLFWFWTFTYAGKYVAQIPPVAGFRWFGEVLKIFVIPAGPLLWAISFLGLLCLIRYKAPPSRLFFAISFFLFSLLSVSPGFYFRQHYFLLLLPSAGLLAGICLDHVRGKIVDLAGKGPKWLADVVVVCIVAAGVGHSAYANREWLFFMTPGQIIRTTYYMNPFEESVEIARFIDTRSGPSDTIAVLGSEPQIYFYAKRRAATGYMYVYPLVENHPFALQMQKEMISQIERAMPRHMVFVNCRFSWLKRPEAPSLILEWFGRFQEKNYDLVGIIDMISVDKTVYVWGEEARAYRKKSDFWVAVLERKGGA